MQRTNRLSLYITEGHASVTVEIAVRRETTARTVPEMLAGMPPDDRTVLETFCRVILAAPRLTTSQETVR